METLLKQSTVLQSIIESQTEMFTSLEDLYYHVKLKLHAKISFSEQKKKKQELKMAFVIVWEGAFLKQSIKSMHCLKR